MTPVTPYQDTEEETGRAADSLTDWRRMASILDVLNPLERNVLISFCSDYTALSSEQRVLVREIARALVARGVQ